MRNDKTITRRHPEVSLWAALTIAFYLSPAVLVAAESDEAAATGARERVMHLAGEHQISFGAGLTLVAQKSDNSTNDAGASYSVDLVFEGDFNDKGKAFLYIDTSQGTSPDTRAVTVANADSEVGILSVDHEGFSETRIAEAWYQMPIGQAASFTIGKIDPTGIYDGNDIANDETAQFLGGAFVNNPAIAFPGYAAGASLEVTPHEQIALRLGFFEATADFEGALDKSFMIGELGVSANIAQRPGNVRLIAWSEDVDDNNGFALSADQQISDAVSLFARYGNQDDKQDFDNAYSLGGQWSQGPYIVGLGYSVLTSTGSAGPDDESQTEFYMRRNITDNIHVTLDLQHIANPGFDGAADDVVVYGLRGQFDL